METDHIVKVRVIRRWQGATVNPDEVCGISLGLAETLAAIPREHGGPAVQILSRDPVPSTAGTGADPWFGAGGNQSSLYELVSELLAQLRAARVKN